MQPPATIEHTLEEEHKMLRIERNRAAIDLLRAWREEGDDDEQRMTGEYLLNALADEPLLIGREADDPCS